MTAQSTASVSARLAVMMFLQFFVWGAWYVTLGPFMAAMKMSDGIGDAYTVGPIAAIIAPLFLGMIADRFFASQRVLGVMHLLGGAVLMAVPTVAASIALQTKTTLTGEIVEFRPHLVFVGLLLVHMLCYMPTLGLSNTVSFHNITNPEKQFPLIRVLGTIGWIVAGFVVGSLMTRAAAGSTTPAAAQGVFFYAAGGAAIVLGLFSFTLPHTPPPAKGKPFSITDALGLDAIKLLAKPSFAVFTLCSFLICIPLAAYYSFAGVYAGATGFTNVPVTMTYGQMSEILFMLIMPAFFARLGVKWMLAVGMLAWVLRYGLFSMAWDTAGTEHVKWMVLAGIILHGICYDFFFVTGQIYVDKSAPKEVRGQAQGFLVLVTQGLGLGLGAQVIGRVVKHYTTPGTAGAPDALAWDKMWMVPTMFALGVLVLFVVAFKEKACKNTEVASS